MRHVSRLGCIATRFSARPTLNSTTKPLALNAGFSALFHRMALPTGPVTLTVGELLELNRKLSDMRHDINNHLSLMVAALELIRYKMKKGAVLDAWEQVKAGGGFRGPPASVQEFEAKLRENVEQTERMVSTLGDQPARITEAVRLFSKEFEQVMGIKKP